MGSQEELNLDLWEAARVDPQADFLGPPPVRTVFGYGSLIFRPGFPYSCAYPAYVRGFLRRFWQRSSDHRGTPEAPGRVATLVQASEAGVEDVEAAVVYGMAYDVADADWDSVLAELDFRERHGYVRTVAELFEVKGQCAGGGDAEEPPARAARRLPPRAVVYYVYQPKQNGAYAGPEPVAATARVIATARGPSGANDGYLLALDAALREHSLPPDPYLVELVAAVKGVQQEEAVGPAANDSGGPSPPPTVGAAGDTSATPT